MLLEAPPKTDVIDIAAERTGGTKMLWRLLAPWEFLIATQKRSALREPARGLLEATEPLRRRLAFEIAPEEPVDGKEFVARRQRVLRWFWQIRIPEVYGDDRSPVESPVLCDIIGAFHKYGPCRLGGHQMPKAVLGIWEGECDWNLILTVMSHPSAVSPQDSLDQFEACLREIRAAGKRLRQKAMFAVGKLDMGILVPEEVGQTYADQWQHKCLLLWGYCGITEIIDVLEAAKEMQSRLRERLFLEVEGTDCVELKLSTHD